MHIGLELEFRVLMLVVPVHVTFVGCCVSTYAASDLFPIYTGSSMCRVALYIGELLPTSVASLRYSCSVFAVNMGQQILLVHIGCCTTVLFAYILFLLKIKKRLFALYDKAPFLITFDMSRKATIYLRQHAVTRGCDVGSC